MRKTLFLLVALAISLSLLRTCRTPDTHPGLQPQEEQRTRPEPPQAADLTAAEEEVTPIPEREAVTPAPTERAATSTAKKGGRLAGRVVDDAGTPVPGCRVELKNGGAERTQIAGKSGEFLFTEVRKGAVKLSVSSSATLLCFPTPYAHGCAEEERPWYGATCLDFDGSEKDSVVLVLRRAAFLEGRVVDSFGAPLSGAVAELKCDEAEFLRVMAEMELTGDDGRFSARVFPGTTRLRTFTSPGSALAGSGRPPEGEYLLGPGETLDVGDLVIGGGGVNLTGRVVNQKGYGVHLVPVRARLVGAPEWMTTETGRTGSFKFEGVYPGRYQVEVAPYGALEGHVGRYLVKDHPVHEVDVTGEGGSYAIGNFALEFDDSYHFFGRLEFSPESTVVREHLRVFAVPLGPQAPAEEEVYFSSPDDFAWHARDPSLYGEVQIEVREIDPTTQESRSVWLSTCRPVAQGRERMDVSIP